MELDLQMPPFQDSHLLSTRTVGGFTPHNIMHVEWWLKVMMPKLTGHSQVLSCAHTCT